MKKFQLALLSSLFCVAACQCGDPPTQQTSPEVIAEASGLSLEGCPVVGADNQPVEGAAPTEGVVSLTNLGRATATLALTLAGPDAARFTLGEFDAELAPDNTVEVPILFSPTAAGAVSATLQVDDGDPETEVLVVALTGSGLSLPPQPTLKVSVESAPGSNQFVECPEGFTCNVDFPALFFGQSSVQRVRLENLGCPVLKVNALEITKGVVGENLAFFLDSPVPPTELTPILLNLADGTQTVDLALRFSPVEDDEQSDSRRGILTILTNDPEKSGGELLSLQGEGLRPAFSAAPSFCNYTRLSDDCGNTPKQANVATFTLTNDGNVDLTIDAAVFANGGQGGRFTVPTNLVGTTLIANGGTHTFNVNHADNTLFVQDVLEVSANAGGMPAGFVFLLLSGGTPPRITVTPEPLAFEDGGTGTTRIVNIGASADAGVLTVGNVAVDALSAGTPNPFFKVTSAPSAGTRIDPGTSLPVTVEYTRPPSGGSQESTLRVASNDPGYPPPDHRQVRIYSQGPPDLTPVAVLVGPGGEQEAVIWTAAQLSASSNRVPLDARDSYDPQDDGSQLPITQFLWRLERNPGGATLQNASGASIGGVKQSEGQAFLTFTTAPAGTRYDVSVEVTDDVGNKNKKVLTILFQG